MTVTWILSSFLGVLGVLFLYLKHLDNCFSVSAVPAQYIQELPADEDLQRIDYSAIDDCAGLPDVSGTNWVVVGGAGCVGIALVELLVKHGAPAVRIVDIQDAPAKVLALKGVEYVKTDIRDPASVTCAFRKPFGAHRPLSVHVTAGVMRFSERLSYVKDLSFSVNSQGVQNVVDAVAALPGEKRLIHTSSVAAFFQNSWLFLGQRRANLVLRDGEDLPERQLLQQHYSASKRAGEWVVRRANGVNGLRTAILRPGMGIISPGGLFICIELTSTPNVNWSGTVAQSAVCAKDVARAQIFCDAALRDRPDEIAGQSFCITGEPLAYTLDACRYMTQLFAGRDLRYISVRPTVLLLPAVMIEIFLYIRFHVLRVFQSNTLPIPRALAMIARLQPSAWTYASVDAVVDDARARRMLGYFHVWPTPHAVKWTVDETESQRKRG